MIVNFNVGKFMFPTNNGDRANSSTLGSREYNYLIQVAMRHVLVNYKLYQNVFSLYQSNITI